MPHLDSEDLVLLALGETSAPDHLASCAHCQAELETLTEIVGVGRETRDVRQWEAPPARVWDAITAGITAGPAAPVPGARANGSARRRRGVPRWVRTAAVAVAAAAIGVAGTITVIRATSTEDSTVVAARADLTAFGSTPPAAHGSATVVEHDGTPQLELHVANLPAAGGYYEVWLINPDTLQMFSVGILGGQSDVLLPLPSTVDLKTYRLVDVSAEQYDGNSAHSGRSLLRGTLTL